MHKAQNTSSQWWKYDGSSLQYYNNLKYSAVWTSLFSYLVISFSILKLIQFPNLCFLINLQSHHTHTLSLCQKIRTPLYPKVPLLLRYVKAAYIVRTYQCVASLVSQHQSVLWLVYTQTTRASYFLTFNIQSPRKAIVQDSHRNHCFILIKFIQYTINNFHVDACNYTQF